MGSAPAPEPRPSGPWKPPRWLRDLHLVAADARSPSPTSPEERLRVVFALMSFAATYLREQADRRGCTVHELRRTYELSVDRLRARG